MKKYYVTFHKMDIPNLQEKFPNVSVDGVFELSALSADEAEEKVVAKLGDNWLFISQADELSLDSYPLGVLATI